MSRNKLFTILNVIGLALGMSVGLLFVALLSFLSTFDNFHQDKDRIYRVTTQIYDNQDNPHYASAPVPLAQKLEEEVTGIEKVVRIHRSLYGEAVYGDKNIKLGGYFADPEFFEVFNFPLLQGNIATALANPNSIVISETEAQKIFSDRDAMGEMISLAPYGEFIVTGIVEDLPENSHMQFGAVASYSTISSLASIISPGEEGWKSFNSSFVYFRLHKNADPRNVVAALNEIARSKYPESNYKASFNLQSLNKIVPGPELYDPIGPNWGYLGIFLISSLVLIILIPACSNYAHLSIAQSLERMREIGVRKVMGGQKKHILLQFIVESVTIVLLALFLAYFFFEIIRTDFLHQMAETSPMDLSPTLGTFIGFLLFALLVGIGAGIVPALYFIKISPIDALKGKEVKSRGRFPFRKIVLTSQFMLSLGFIMAVVIMMRQYQYSVNYDFGFEQEDVLDVKLQNVAPHVFQHEFAKLSSVKEISMSSHLLGIGSASKEYIKTFDLQDSIEAASMAINERFISNLKLELLAGNDFIDGALNNSQLIIVNEEFVKDMQLDDPGSAIDRSFILNDGRQVRIAGVLKNFHYTDLKAPIKSFYFEYDPAKYNYANMKMHPGDMAGGIAAMETVWKNIGGEGKFTAQLFTDEIKEAYEFYIMIMKLWGFLGLLAITVACLGLLGTVSFTIRKRFKEISIRKVMGASSKNLVFLLSRDFVILMLVASVVTIPVVYLLFTFLLTDLQHYSIEIGFIEILVSLVIMMTIGLSAVLSQTLKAANANPVDNLRSD